MRSLIWKDYRLARPLLVFAGAVLAITYLLGAVMEFKSSWPALPPGKSWGGMLVAYGTVALYLVGSFAGLLGGHAIACERADRTAHFLGYLPPTKTQILGSKLIVAAAAIGVIWAWILLSVGMLAPRLVGGTVDFNGSLFDAIGGLELCALTFGVGWLASAVFESALVPIILALASPIVLGLVLVATCDLLGVPRFDMGKFSGPLSACTGAAAFVLGTWLYFRRVEP